MTGVEEIRVKVMVDDSAFDELQDKLEKLAKKIKEVNSLLNELTSEPKIINIKVN